MNKDYPFKNYWFWVVAVLVVGISFFYITFNLPASYPANLARLTIEFDKDNTRAFEGPVEGDMTVLQALLSSSRGGGFDLRYSLDEDSSINLASIDDTVNMDNYKKWHFFLNGSPVRAGEIGKIKIKNGDSIEARYE